MDMNCRTGRWVKCMTVVPLVLIGIPALGWGVMALWNWLMPSLFAGAKEIDFLQAMGVLVLSRILFGGRGRGCPGRWHRHRWENMTPEEREKFKAGIHRCGCGKSQNTAEGGE